MKSLRLGLSLTGAPPTVDPTDTTPNQFTFTDATGVSVSATQTSNTITLSGMNSTTSATLSGAASSELQVNGGAWGAGPATVGNGDQVAVRHTSSASNSTAVNTTLTIDGVSDTFTSTTVAAASWQPSDSSASVVFIASTSSCFTDTLGTTPVASDGDTVRCIRDAAGNRIVYNTNGSYPLYRTNSGKPYLDCTGTLEISSQSAGQLYALTDGSGNGTFGTALRALGTGTEIFVWAGHVWAETGGGVLRMTANRSGGTTGKGSGVAPVANTDYRLIGRVTAPRTLDYYTNTTTNGAATAATDVTAYTSKRIDALNSTAATNGCRIYRFAGFPSALDSTNITNLDTWLQAGF